ncbi:MAG: aminotransferase class I/II-fold pyridoxal phosphate-dependent enzyme, partial [Deltaproteobacteria bacterium]
VAGALTGTLPDTEAYRRNRERLLKIFSKCGIEFVPPEGAFYFFPKTPWGLGDEDFVLAAREEKILVVPGGGFGAPGHFRVAFCVDPVVVERSEEAWMRLAGRFS